MNTISWQGPTTPLPMEINPRVVFERMFGGAGTAEERLERMRTRRSILDSVSKSASKLQQGLGARDQSRLSDYLDNVREIERRIERSEQQTRRGPQGARGAGRGARGLRGARRADVRPDGAGVSGRHHPRLHVHDGARPAQRHLSADRRGRAASRPVASSEQAGQDRRASPRSTPITSTSSAGSSRSCRRRPTATARCSITRSCSTAAAWATPTCTATWRCRI